MVPIDLSSVILLLGDPLAGSFDGVYKVFQLTERIKLRVNVDAFNALNIQGRVNPSPTDGIESLQTSYWTPRQVQFSARVTF
jgi:hypothetical protein